MGLRPLSVYVGERVAREWISVACFDFGEGIREGSCGGHAE